MQQQDENEGQGSPNESPFAQIPTCAVQGCNQLANYWCGQYRTYCYDHTCVRGGCDEPATAVPRICANHKCVRCNESRQFQKTLCSTCGCNATGCQEEVVLNSRFCDAHRHFGRTCIAFDCGESTQDGSEVCPMHQCAFCNRLRQRGKTLCSICGCNAPYCQERSIENCSACADHLCPVPECTEPVGPQGLHCLDHTCDEHGCEQPATHSRVPIFCYCDDHFQEDLFGDAEDEEEEEQEEDEDGDEDWDEEDLEQSLLEFLPCRAPGCTQPSITGQLACEKHKCPVQGCDEAQNLPSPYCEFHGKYGEEKNED